ncbi:MAG: hypothetical protein C0399_04100 [Syntrophus sp. (in: bacteria)]|nr:hypothetical protein [Syntrophus sp. (in: bacteria)]
MHTTRLVLIFSVICLTVMPWFASAQTIPEEARRHMDRGQAAIEMAKTDADLEDAVREFQKAIELAPTWPDPYYNLGMVQSKMDRLNDAIRNLTRYLQLTPQSRDAPQVRQLINRIEYKKEKTEKERMDPNSLVGIWVPEDPFYRFEIRNNNGIVEGGLRAYEFTEERGLSRRPRFVPIQWDGRSLVISPTWYFYCDKSVQMDCCPTNASLSLTMIAKDTLKGTIRVEPNKKWNPAGLTDEYVWKRVK